MTCLSSLLKSGHWEQIFHEIEALGMTIPFLQAAKALPQGCTMLSELSLIATKISRERMIGFLE